MLHYFLLAICGLYFSTLVEQLGSPKWAVRERAQVKLAAFMPHTANHLVGNKKLEISLRANGILSDYCKKQAVVLAERTLPKNRTVYPWIDMLPADYPCRDSIVSTYLGRAQGKVGRYNSPQWDDYRLATKLFFIQLYSEGNPVREVQCLVDQMSEGERQWIINNGKRYNPPLEPWE